MLQIASGKFFREGEELMEQPIRKVLYSNYGWVNRIQTVAGSLDPIDRGLSIVQYIFEYTNRLPADQGSPNFRMVVVGEATVVEQFRMLAMFGLRGYFSTERQDVARNCRSHPLSGHDRLIPANYVRRYFDPHIHGDLREIDRFEQFIRKVIGLPRASYQKVIACLGNFSDALEILNYNIDLSYSMLVYSLEALVADFDAFAPVWADYTDPIKDDLEAIFKEMPTKTANRVRETLLRHGQFRLGQRFIAFVTAHLGERFHTDDAVGVSTPIRPSELRRALQNVYQARSNYVHSLKSIQTQMKARGVAESEVFHWLNEPYLTFSGLSRLTYEVISQFINRQPHCERESFAWQTDLPDVITLTMAPQYWIWRAETATAPESGQRFSGFLQSLSELLTKGTAIADMRDVLRKYEALFSQSKIEDQLNMLGLYGLWTLYLPNHGASDNARKFIDGNEGIFKDCSIQGMITFLLTQNEWIWTTEDCAATYNAYEKRRVMPLALRAPLQVELALMLEVANKYTRDKNVERRNSWLDATSLEAAGLPGLQQKIKLCREQGGEFGVLAEFFPVISEPVRDDTAVDRSERVRRRAYEIWEQRLKDSLPGDAFADWIAAERADNASSAIDRRKRVRIETL